jgi:hypothetical protein
VLARPTEFARNDDIAGGALSISFDQAARMLQRTSANVSDVD